MGLLVTTRAFFAGYVAECISNIPISTGGEYFDS
jgi:hypothetical protein